MWVASCSKSDLLGFVAQPGRTRRQCGDRVIPCEDTLIDQQGQLRREKPFAEGTDGEQGVAVRSGGAIADRHTVAEESHAPIRQQDAGNDPGRLAAFHERPYELIGVGLQVPAARAPGPRDLARLRVGVGQNATSRQ